MCHSYAVALGCSDDLTVLCRETHRPNIDVAPGLAWLLADGAEYVHPGCLGTGPMTVPATVRSVSRHATSMFAASTLLYVDPPSLPAVPRRARVYVARRAAAGVAFPSRRER